MAAAAAGNEEEMEALNERQEAIEAWYTDRFMRASTQAVALMIAGEFFETDELSEAQYQVWLEKVCGWRATLTEEASQYDEVAEDSEGEDEEAHVSLQDSQRLPSRDGKEEDIDNTPPSKRKRD